MTGLHMISVVVALGPLRRLAAVHGVAPDEGRMLHHGLSECFGKGVIQPFRLLPGRSGSSHATLYGYTSASLARLNETAAATAPPELADLFDLSSLAAKAMPDSWPAGRRVAFDLRCIPVRRLLHPLASWPGEGGATKPYAKGAEVDVYLVDVMRQYPEGLPDDFDRLRLREQLYIGWLAERLAPAAELHSEATTLASFRTMTVRRGHQRQTAPEAIFHGELTIKDPEAFSRLLASGVGRHGAYGFGMMLLRPARS